MYCSRVKSEIMYRPIWDIACEQGKGKGEG